MTLIGWIQIALYCSIIAALTPIVGGYMTRVRVYIGQLRQKSRSGPMNRASRIRG